MIKISLKQEYGIFKQPFERELPDFTIITGLNGAGKSQLLQAIKNNQITATIQDNIQLSDIRLYRYGNENNNSNEHFKPYDNSSYYRGEEIRTRILDVFNNYVSARNDAKIFNKSIEDIIQSKHPYILKWIKDIATNSEKDIKNLKFDDFIQHIPMDFTNNNNYIGHNFAYPFMLYVYKKQHNKYMEFLNTIKGEKDSKYYTDEAFVKQFGPPPWEFVNQVLETWMGYRVNHPYLDMEKESTFVLEFENIATKEKVQLDTLSSGEKVIMALTLAIYHAKAGSANFPQFILMDEPDAPLHPSMSKEFLKIIQDVFVKEKGVKIIMTTHSPSTVALVENENSLFIMDKETRIPRPTTRDEALLILTDGIPTLSINYENRKQVFVESDYDLYFYNHLYDILKSKLGSPISLNFISSGNPQIGNGSSSRVKHWVKELNTAGNKSIYGIIDKDVDNKETSNIKVLQRYSIENYIFDPVILSAFLLNEPAIKKVFPVLQAKKYTEFATYKNKELQPLIDFILDSINIPKEDTAMQEITYQNGVKINIPNWYLSYRGHDLVDKLIMQFEPLKQYGKREYDLQKAILDSVMTDLPGFIPMDIVELFKSIQQ